MANGQSFVTGPVPQAPNFVQTSVLPFLAATMQRKQAEQQRVTSALPSLIAGNFVKRTAKGEQPDITLGGLGGLTLQDSPTAGLDTALKMVNLQDKLLGLNKQERVLKNLNSILNLGALSSVGGLSQGNDLQNTLQNLVTQVYGDQENVAGAGTNVKNIFGKKTSKLPSETQAKIKQARAGGASNKAIASWTGLDIKDVEGVQ